MNSTDVVRKVDILSAFFKRTGYMFYMMNPSEHLFETVEEVPDYYKEVTPSFIFVIILEATIGLLRGKPSFRINDTITNICQGMLVEIFKIPFLGVELVAYTWIYNNWRLVTLPWDSVFTWFIGMVIGDFLFYWMHRSIHQISFLWNFHEVHHSSEEYNTTVPLRIHVFTSASIWYAYLPLAFAIPPQVFLVHYQLLIIFQFWLHSELIPPLGLLEWVLNTPSYHRVHHGRNRRFIDKNFGSVLIIWDRLFGTFEPATDEDIKYGVTTPVQTFNSFWLQTNHFWPMCKKFIEMKVFRNNIWSVIKGPGWSPGKPWLGNVVDIPEELPTLTVMSCSFFIMISTVTFGGIFDGRSWVLYLEIARCLLYFIVEFVVSSQVQNLPFITEMTFMVFRILFTGSLAFWLARLPDAISKFCETRKLQEE